jgi:predicted PurR-regulated permease PerM
MNNYTGRHFFLGLLAAIAVISIFIFLPFLTPVVFAVSLAVIFGPVYRYILKKLFPKKEKSTIAAFITLALVGIIVIVPGFFIVSKMYSEIQNMYFYLTEEGGRASVINSLNTASKFVSNMLFDVYPAFSFDDLNVTDYLQQGLEWGFGHVDTLFSGIGKIILGLVVVLFALFYFLRDGAEFKKQIIALSPLMDKDDESIFKKLEQAVYSIVGGSLVVSVIQGILTGIGFALFRVPDPTVWGTMAAVAALIPGVGTALVIVPGILYLFVTGSTGNAIGLLIWGLLAVGLIDNLLGPLVVNRGIKIHPFVILLSVLGGLSFFGIVGFILGPLIIAFLFALLEIYKSAKTSL